jgi:hypothetical protein
MHGVIRDVLGERIQPIAVYLTRTVRMGVASERHGAVTALRSGRPCKSRVTPCEGSDEQERCGISGDGLEEGTW